jgi:hypothetical protein
MWDGDAISGPVPTLYADNTEVAKKAIIADPAKAHQVPHKYFLKSFIFTNHSFTGNNM